LPAFLNPL